MNPFLSIIIPAYNEENRLPGSLREILRFVSEQPYAVEVLIVENGSSDRTYLVAEDFCAQNEGFRVIREKNSGKGLAVCRGMREASGEFRFMCDADLSMPIDELVKFLPPRLADFDIAIGSREAQGAVRYDEPAYRHLGGRAVNTMIRLLALPGLHDTQCGFKCFRAEVADDLFRYQTLNGWSFDIEILYIARLRKYKVVEVPISWHFNPETKLRAIRDAIQMGIDIISIRKNAWSGKYRASDPGKKN
jgi:glycosyltransferase involved in cell wall biosynthesis